MNRGVCSLRRIPDWAANRACDGRLTLTEDTPYPSSDITGAFAETIYFTPAGPGGSIALFDGARWQQRPIRPAGADDPAIKVPASLFRLFDVFASWGGNKLVLETVDWTQNTFTVNGGTNTTPIVISSSTDVTVNNAPPGMYGFAGLTGPTTVNGKTYQCNTPDYLNEDFTLEGSVASGAWTSGGTVYSVPNTRTVALTRQDGVWVKSGDPTRRYLGTGMTTGTSGQCEWSASKLFLWNYHNRVPLRLYKTDTTNTWTYATSSWRAANNLIDNRVEFVVGIVEEPFRCRVEAALASASGVAGGTGIGHNTSVTDSSQTRNEGGGVALNLVIPSTYNAYPNLGYNSLYWIEYRRAGTVTFYGDGGFPTIQSGIHATFPG